MRHPDFNGPVETLLGDVTGVRVSSSPGIRLPSYAEVFAGWAWVDLPDAAAVRSVLGLLVGTDAGFARVGNRVYLTDAAVPVLERAKIPTSR